MILVLISLQVNRRQPGVALLCRGSHWPFEKANLAAWVPVAAVLTLIYMKTLPNRLRRTCESMCHFPKTAGPRLSCRALEAHWQRNSLPLAKLGSCLLPVEAQTQLSIAAATVRCRGVRVFVFGGGSGQGWVD
jgi:hypothetical protein